MNKKKMISIGLLFCMFLYVLVFRGYFLKNLLRYVEFLSAAFVLFICFFSYHFLGFRKNKKNFLKRNVFIITLILLLLFFSVSYGIGLFIGFLRNSYSLKLHSIFDNMISPLIIILGIEIFRYIIINSNKNNKKMLILSTFVIALFEIAITVRGVALTDYAGIFKLITLSILPICVKNACLSYITSVSGYMAPIVYRLAMELYIYVVPVVPDLGEYINSVVGIFLPFILYVYTAKTVREYYNGVEHKFYSDSFGLKDCLMIGSILLFVCMIFGDFTYHMVGIASNSMYPKIKKGDAIIIKKKEDVSDIEVGDIIAFYHDGKIIVHRLMQIEDVGGVSYYRTKGDANNTMDNFDITYEQIEGVVKLKVPYLAYPSVYLNEALN